MEGGDRLLRRNWEAGLPSSTLILVLILVLPTGCGHGQPGHRQQTAGTHCITSRLNEVQPN